MRNVLFISHYFPPVGGAGVQRSAKFVKYLPALGYRPLVLTGQIHKATRWTPEDQSLLADIPASVPIYRANWDLGAPKHHQLALRQEAYIDEGTRIIRETKPDLIFVTMSPFSDARVASELSRIHRLPWVADLRDPWALDEFQVYRTRFHCWLEKRKMRNALSTATSIILNTPEALHRFRAAFPSLKDKCQVSITNGYDAEDFPKGSSGSTNAVFTILHSGYLHTELGLHQRQHSLAYRLLGKVAEGVQILPRSHYYLVQALQKWHASTTPIPEDFIVRLVGVPSPIDKEIVESSPLSKYIEFTGYLPHSDCVRLMRQADVLFMPMHKLRPGERATIVPGKVYEYMASGRPILAAMPPGDAQDFLRAIPSVSFCAPDDVAAMAAILSNLHSGWRIGNSPTDIAQPPTVTRFERKILTQALAEEFQRVLAVCR